MSYERDETLNKSKEVETESKEAADTKEWQLPQLDTLKAYNELQNSWTTLAIDVRSKEQFEASQIPFSINIPFDGDMESYEIMEKLKTYSDVRHTTIDTLIFVTDVRDVRDAYESDSTSNGASSATVSSVSTVSRHCKMVAKLCVELSSEELTSWMINRAFCLFLSVFALDYPLVVCKSDNLPKDNTFSYPHMIIKDQLFIGDFAHACNQRVFKNLKITHVVNVSSNPNFFANDGIKYHTINIKDSKFEQIGKYFNDAVKFIDSALHSSSDANNVNSINSNNNNNQNSNSSSSSSNSNSGDLGVNRVLVHCLAGVSRSATIVTCYIIWKYHWCAKYSIQYLKSRRACVEPNDGFKQQLEEWEQQLKLNYMCSCEQHSS